jgi:hypothetical protein
MEEELKLLRALCDDATPRETRLKLIETCEQFPFQEPEHRVVFESIRALFPLGTITPARLIVHLTRRGFPDVDTEKYLPV